VADKTNAGKSSQKDDGLAYSEAPASSIKQTPRQAPLALEKDVKHEIQDDS